MRRSTLLADLATEPLDVDWPSYHAYSEVADCIINTLETQLECR